MTYTFCIFYMFSEFPFLIYKQKVNFPVYFKNLSEKRKNFYKHNYF